MTNEPRVEQRAAQPYVGIRMPVRMDGLAGAVDSGFPELFGWLGARGLELAAPPFIRYLTIDMEGELEIELGVPVGAQVQGDARIRADVLPAGRYVTLRHIGPFDGLVASHTALQGWAEEQGIAFDTEDSDRGPVWRGRVEHYVIDPSEEPDPAKWEVELTYLTSAR